MSPEEPAVTLDDFYATTLPFPHSKMTPVVRIEQPTMTVTSKKLEPTSRCMHMSLDVCLVLRKALEIQAVSTGRQYIIDTNNCVQLVREIVDMATKLLLNAVADGIRVDLGMVSLALCMAFQSRSEHFDTEEKVRLHWSTREGSGVVWWTSCKTAEAEMKQTHVLGKSPAEVYAAFRAVVEPWLRTDRFLRIISPVPAEVRQRSSGSSYHGT